MTLYLTDPGMYPKTIEVNSYREAEAELENWSKQYTVAYLWDQDKKTIQVWGLDIDKGEWFTYREKPQDG